MGLADASLLWLTFPFTSAATASDLPDVAKLSASSRFLGACLAMAAVTAAMNAALSNVPAGAAAMSPALASLACASLSSAGGLAAFPASAALALAGGCLAACCFAATTLALVARNPGCSAGAGALGGTGGGGMAPPAARRCTTVVAGLPASRVPTAALPATACNWSSARFDGETVDDPAPTEVSLLGFWARTGGAGRGRRTAVRSRSAGVFIAPRFGAPF